MRTNFEKIRTKKKDRRQAAEFAGEPRKRRKKTQDRGGSAKRMDWDQLQTNIKVGR